jgi:pimeloyl-ACP methyl ester carboxylesterase
LTSALRTFPSFEQLADALSSQFSVYTYDRRGRGDSGDTQPYSREREIEDLQALIAEAGGAACVHGLSSGGILGLTATLHGAAITKLVLFEPPVSTEEPDPSATAKRDELIAAGRDEELVEQFVTSSVGLSPDMLDSLRQSPEWARLKTVAHTLAYDGAITGDPTLWTEQAPSVCIPVLVLDSDASPQHLRTAARAAANALPTAGYRTIAGSIHDAPADVVAPVLAAFFATSHEPSGSRRGSAAGPAGPTR